MSDLYDLDNNNQKKLRTNGVILNAFKYSRYLSRFAKSIRDNFIDSDIQTNVLEGRTCFFLSPPYFSEIKSIGNAPRVLFTAQNQDQCQQGLSPENSTESRVNRPKRDYLQMPDAQRNNSCTLSRALQMFIYSLVQTVECF